ncbi:MFS transporter [Candidatus Entotheonella palauensis]|uniref:MFS transporter n=1 Tax=Candidatus Entotheonella palauensis TaxID=93172 RepID=UPI000B7E5399|nr:MFS transporter [Candidatus Entotheonella palauensis]
MTYASRNFLFLNIGHALDHFFMLIFATAVLSASMKGDFEGSYGALLLLTTFSFFFFGGASQPAGWLGDKWSRHNMIVVFFIGIGVASIFTGLTTGRLSLQIGLAMIGLLAAIYHPIGIALVAEEAGRMGRALAINGVWGNIGVALAAVTTGAIAEYWGWRAAFIAPGIYAAAIGVSYALHLRLGPGAGEDQNETLRANQLRSLLVSGPLLGTLAVIGVFIFGFMTYKAVDRFGWYALVVLPIVYIAMACLAYVMYTFQKGALQQDGAPAAKRQFDVTVSIQQRVFVFLIVAPLFGGVIFQATTIALPKILSERLTALIANPSEIGIVAAVVFALAALGQVVVGELLDRYPIRQIYLSVVSVQLLLCALAVSAFGWLALLVTTPLMLATFGAIPMNDWIVANYIGSRWRSRVYAVKSLMSLSVGAIAVQLSGRLYDLTGSFEALFMVMTGCAALVILGALFLLPARPPEPVVVPAEQLAG